MLHLGLHHSAEIFTVFIKTLWPVGDPMATADFPVFAHRQQEYTGSKHDNADIVTLDEGNSVQSEELKNEAAFNGIIGSSPALKFVLSEVERVAPTDSTVLVLGETGTGKELIASAIHNLSSRRRNNFVRFNCAAVPAGLLESDLFGHERGAFTGALTRKLGRFEVANKGTAFSPKIMPV